MGRAAQLRGDGTLELTPLSRASRMGSSPLPADSSVNTFSVQAFTDLSAVSWDRSSALTKLLTIATVCNKAKFTFAEEGSSAGENVCNCWNRVVEDDHHYAKWLLGTPWPTILRQWKLSKLWSPSQLVVNCYSTVISRV